MKNRKPTKPRRPREEKEEIVRLEDLAPREEPKGGGRRKKLFGQFPTRRPPSDA